MPVSLQLWNTLITYTLHPENEGLLSLTGASIELFIQESKDEKDKVRTEFLQGILERPKHRDQQQYVKLHQAMLRRLLYKLYTYNESEGLDVTILDLYQIIRRHLEEILDFIEDFFGNYFESKSEVYVHVPFKGSEIYLLHKAFIDSGGASGETYKSLFEKTGSHLINKKQKGFSTESLQKSSDKVDPEAKENVKRFLQKMIRNIESYN